jgi:TolB-like protein/Tfp pilus assembly protein PilF
MNKRNIAGDKGDGGAVPTAAAVGRQLQKVLASEEFDKSPRMRRFLRFIVAETMEGRPGHLNEHLIAHEVFDRDETFDPTTNSVVRVEASRLRRRLKQYYLGPGKGDPIAIELPVGTYAPRVDWLAGYPGNQEPRRATQTARPPDGTASPDKPSIVVLPFANLSGDPEQEVFADGIVEEIITELSRFGELRVMGSLSMPRYKDRAADVRDVGRDLGVDYVLEGSVRRDGDRLRVTTQLLDAQGGAHLWAETYQRDLTANDIFDIQDDITAQVVREVGGVYGAVARERMNRLRRDRADNLAAYDSMRLYHQWLSTFDDGDYCAAREALEAAVKIDPSYADAWGGLSSIYACEVTLFYILNRDSLDRALVAAQHAIHLAPDHAIGHRTLAHARLLRREDTAFFEAVERAITVNPNDMQHLGIVGIYLCFAGDWDRGLALLETATARDPLSARVSRVIEYLDHYRKGEFDQALAIADDSVGIGREADYLFVAAACGEMGRLDDAHGALEALFRLCPDIMEFLSLYRHRAFDFILDGLRKAGLNIPDRPESADL